jgi:hypothetical protein
MRKIFFVLFGILFFNPLCFSQEPVMSTNETVSSSADTQVFTGTVALMDFEEPAKDFPARIEAVDEGGQRLVFVATKKLPIHAKDGKLISLRKIKDGDKITIDYTKKHNSRFVQSIAVVE